MKSKYSIGILIALIFACLSSFSACQKEVPTLTNVQQKIIDTLVMNQTKILRVELDSLCDLRFEKEMAQARDSMIKIRFAEFKERLGK